jgi:predicted transcriptional regulator of viral defense system
MVDRENRGNVSIPAASRHRHIVTKVLGAQGIARLAELRAAGATAAAISRMEQAGEIVRLGRGLYQLPDAPMSVHHNLVTAAKRVPKGVVCLASALAFHGLTEHLPRQVWLAVSTADWARRTTQPQLRIVQMADRFLTADIDTHLIDGVPVRIFSVARTVADCFRHRRRVGLAVALEGLQEALRQRKATPAELARQADLGGVSTVMRPYLEALTANA